MSVVRTNCLSSPLPPTLCCTCVLNNLMCRAERRQETNAANSREANVSELQLGAYLRKASLKAKEVSALVQLNSESATTMSIPRALAAAAAADSTSKHSVKKRKHKDSEVIPGAGTSLGIKDASGRGIESELVYFGILARRICVIFLVQVTVWLVKPKENMSCGKMPPNIQHRNLAQPS